MEPDEKPAGDYLKSRFHEPIVIMLEKLKFFTRIPAADLVEIENIIKKYGKVALNEENLYLIKGVRKIVGH